jgi:hypothetical protein
VNYVDEPVATDLILSKNISTKKYPLTISDRSGVEAFKL